MTINEDGFAVDDGNSGNFIVGEMLKYVDGVYYADKTREVPHGTVLVVVGVVTAWVRWRGNKPVEHRVTKLGEPHPVREDLGDLDESTWEVGFDGKGKADPWHDTRYVRLVDPVTGASFTFITDSYGGRRAVGNLKSSIMNVRMAHPNALPVVRLATGTFKSPTYGPRKRPDFVIVDWRRRNGGATVERIDPPKPSAPQLVKPEREPEPEPAPERDDMDDDIPF